MFVSQKKTSGEDAGRYIGILVVSPFKRAAYKPALSVTSSRITSPLNPATTVTQNVAEPALNALIVPCVNWTELGVTDVGTSFSNVTR